MHKRLKAEIFVFTVITILIALVQEPSMTSASETSGRIKISGLVNRPLNLTYADLLSFPMISEVTTLECVDRSWKVTFNWTGVSLFHLLTLAEIKPEAYDVVFRAPNDYSSSVNITEALKPTTILALIANGTLLSEITNRAGGFRVVVPCKWGYKWVRDIEEIEVVDYDHKGTWEGWGFSDEADMPDCVMPSTTPSLQEFNVSLGSRSFQVKSFTNVSVTAFNFDYTQKEVSMNISVPTGTTGFADFILHQDLLGGPYTVFLDGERIDVLIGNVTNLTFLYFAFPEGLHVAKIVGERFFGAVPDIIVRFNQTVYVGETVIFNASESVDDGKIVSFEWDFGDGTSGNGAVVFHSYIKEGLYNITLNATDDDTFSSFATLAVTVRKQNGYVPTVASLVTAVIVGSLVLTLLVLLLKSRAKRNSLQQR